MITGDLDAELIAAARAITAELPATGPTWRPALGGDPAAFATSLPFELSRRTGRPPGELAAALAAALGRTGWISSARPTGAGYLTITVTGSALASVAARIVLAGADCARSLELREASADVPPWPDLATAPTWRRAWQDQAAAMTGRFAHAAGASIHAAAGQERQVHAPQPAGAARSPVAAAAAFLGAGSVRYRLARTLPGRVGELAAASPGPDQYGVVQLAHAEAASTLRWAADLGLPQPDPVRARAGLLGASAEQALLGLLSWFPLRVAAAARRRRPAEVPHYLEQLAAAWTGCRLACPALPFGGAAAPREPDLAAARLLLAAAVATVLASGLGLAGLEPAATVGAAGVS